MMPYSRTGNPANIIHGKPIQHGIHEPATAAAIAHQNIILTPDGRNARRHPSCLPHTATLPPPNDQQVKAQAEHHSIGPTAQPQRQPRNHHPTPPLFPPIFRRRNPDEKSVGK
jgi:hypothetical protein